MHFVVWFFCHSVLRGLPLLLVIAHFNSLEWGTGRHERERGSGSTHQPQDPKIGRELFNMLHIWNLMVSSWKHSRKVGRGFAKGWFPKGWFWRLFPRNENRNEGTFAKTTLLETALLSPNDPFQKGGFQKGGFGGTKPERGYVRQNHPFTKPPFYLPVSWKEDLIICWAHQNRKPQAQRFPSQGPNRREIRRKERERERDFHYEFSESKRNH